MTRVFIVSFSIICILASCKKLVDVPAPATLVTDENVFKNDETAIATVTGLYSQLMSNNRAWFNSGITTIAGLSSDEINTTLTNSELQEIQTNQILETNNTIWANLWVSAYTHVYHINAALEGIDNSSQLTPKTRDQLKGELLFIRALTYHYLINLFGDVPLILSTDYRESAVKSRTTTEDVYNQIISDLLIAKSLLVNSYPTQGRVRPNRMAVFALLSRIYLYQKDWLNAETAASEVINSGMYNLVANLNNVFLTNSAEAIWQLVPVLPTTNTGEGNQFVPLSTSSTPMYILTDQFMSSFEQGDNRKSSWTKTNVISGIPYTFPYKYKLRTGSPPYTESNNVLRLAEQYLIRAEARAWLNKVPEGKNDLNIIRSRAGLPATTASDNISLLEAIINERRIELGYEYGHRWMDLKRWGLANNILGAVKTNWNAEDVLYPIPFIELQRNRNLTQNPGY